MSSLLIRCITAAVAVPLLLVIIILLPQMNHLAFSIVIVLVNAIGTFELHNNILRKKIDVPFTGYLAILLPIVELINSYTIKNDETYEREVSALSKLPKVYPCKRRMIITYDEEATLTDEYGVIEVVPCWKWMLQQA